MTALEKQDECAPLRYGFSAEQIDVIKATIAPGSTNEELALFLMVCQKTGLDPFSRQIYLSERRSKDPQTGQWTTKKTPETTIDGFRCIAERSGEYEGQDGPYWCGTDGKWVDVWLDMQNMPAAAKVGIWRKGFRAPVWGVALFEEYKQTKGDGSLNSMWTKMGANQIAKCAESLGLRKAFPRDLSGMYTREEMAQASEREPKDAQQDVAARKIKELSASRSAPGYDDPTGVFTQQAEEKRHQDLAQYEERHRAMILEANAVLEQPPEPPLMAPNVKKPPAKARQRGAISFEALKAWGEIKKEILALTGTTELYYKALAAGGYEHADAIKTKEDAAKIWKALKEITAELSKDKQNRTVEEELARYQSEMNDKDFINTLGAHGFESISDVIERANGTQLGALLDDLRMPF